MTNEKIFTPRRVPQGSSDAAIFFQQTMERCFASLLYEHLLIWIDDLLLYAANIDTYPVKFGELFSLLNQFGLKLSVKKSSLYQTQVKWCGRIIDGQGIRHDPQRIDSLRAMPYPRTAAELQQFVCAINWMRDNIIDFARQVEPLQRRLDQALASTKRTKCAAASIEIELNERERRSFDNVKEVLASAATLDFPDD
ncbi:Retroelement [Phytophthora megakarya]|uniref:Retroelement n=1 Tax=Phytophthora megakarya TaxID=4795 RepID=A0A225W1Q2_9STRA|nr:Retroelement [Phytophthora megakarya]